MPDTVKARLADVSARLLARPDAPPGAVVALGRPESSAVRAAGLRSRDGSPMTPGTAFDLGSVTKVVGTTTMLIRLVEAGLLTLSDEHRLWLRHRAGLWEWWPLYAEPAPPLETIGSLPLRHEPDTGRHYSDLGFMLLGELVTSVTGKDLRGSFADLVAGPFGLEQTAYGAPVSTDVAAGQSGDEIERTMIATGEPYPVPVPIDAFTGWRTGVLAGEVGDGNAFHAFGGAAGHAGLFSTAPDLLGWGRALLGLDPEVLRMFWAEGPDPGQRLGFRSRSVHGCAAYEHPGFPGAGVAVFPAHAATVVLLTNRLHRPGPPVPFEPWWALALDGVHEVLREDEPCG